MGRMGVLCYLGTAVNFEHPLRRCAPRPLRGAKGREAVGVDFSLGSRVRGNDGLLAVCLPLPPPEGGGENDGGRNVHRGKIKRLLPPVIPCLNAPRLSWTCSRPLPFLCWSLHA